MIIDNWVKLWEGIFAVSVGKRLPKTAVVTLDGSMGLILSRVQ